MSEKEKPFSGGLYDVDDNNNLECGKETARQNERDKRFWTKICPGPECSSQRIQSIKLNWQTVKIPPKNTFFILYILKSLICLSWKATPAQQEIVRRRRTDDDDVDDP